MASNKSKRTTIKDVARECGVDISTVSRILNNRSSTHSYAEATREKVLAACRRLEYRPNRAAQILASKQKGIIGLSIPDFPAVDRWLQSESRTLEVGLNSFFAAVSPHLEKRNTNVLILHRFDRTNKSEKDPTLPYGRNQEMYHTEILDGLVVLLPAWEDPALRQLIQQKFPVVVMGANPMGLPVHTVDVDNVETTRSMVQHLISLGHQRIAYLWSLPDNLMVSIDRIQGYQKALEEAKMPLSKELIVKIHSNIESGKRAMAHLMTLAEPPTAVVSDRIAVTFGAMEKAEELGVKVPGDISMCTVDLEDANLRRPYLAGNHFPYREIYSKSTEILFKTIDDPDYPIQAIFYQGRFTPGDTLAPPPTERL